ncbi:MAG: tetratricopeptide repeat protein [Candidatus Melainabacteria bacterium]|nr:tetratricopeptide repeat protein [Candidatus Melainabacteria bacterium]
MMRIFRAFRAAALVSLLSYLAISVPVRAMDTAGDDAGQFGSITVTKLAREGLKAAQRQDWPTAVQRYQKAVSQNVKAPELYYGLVQAAAKANNWHEALSAMETLFNEDPAAKAHMQAEYGRALAGVSRYEEAIPILNKALTTLDADNAFLNEKLTAMAIKIEKPGEKPDIDMSKVKYREVTAVEKIPERDLVHADEVSEKSKYTLSYENLFHYSEFIAICTYKKFEKERDTAFFRPPIAIFHIDEVLKGPPLNPTLPIRYEFHDKVGTPVMPKGWTFGPDKLPEPGSKWIIFIENAVPKRGAFETYHGSYGRQEANDENRNKIYKVIEDHRGQQ